MVKQTSSKIKEKIDRGQWEKQATNLLKAELVRRGISNEDLQVALEKMGIKKSLHNLVKTIRMGKFSFAFFLQCAQAIGLNKLHINDDY